MLSIGKLNGDSTAYYLGKVTKHLDDYYAMRGEGAGRWTGSAAAQLGLGRDVDGAVLAQVLAGVDPRSGASLLDRPAHPRRLPGLDLAFSAPKGVSVLWALGSAALQAQLRDAHRAAVADALAWLEQHAGEERTGSGGRDRVSGGGWVCAAFDHRTSRAGDPQLHTHVLVAKLVAPAGPGGTWRSADTARVYAAAKTAGTLYQAVLRTRLAELGVACTVRPTGLSDVAGLPDGLLEEFSRRRRDIEEALARRGASSARSAQRAALSTRRSPAPPAGDDDLREQWRERARAVGVDPGRAQRLRAPGRSLPAVPVDVPAAAERLLSTRGLTEKASTFTRREVLRGLAVALPGGADVAALEAATDAVLADPRVVALEPKADGLARWTTTDLLAAEREVLDATATGRHAGGPMPQPLVDGALAAHPHLRLGQRRLVCRLLESSRLVEVVEGAAGTGKSTALAAARHGWAAAGRRVVGTALARSAASGLQEAAGLDDSDSLARLLSRADRDPHLLRDAVVVLDEAGMVGTRSLHRLLRHVHAAGGQLVLVGDPHQLLEIDAGGVFGRLAARVDTSRLTDNRRQQQAWEVDALADLRCGDLDRALDAYVTQGRVSVGDDADDVRRALVVAWAGDTAAGLDSLMLAATRHDVAELNDLARAGPAPRRPPRRRHAARGRRGCRPARLLKRRPGAAAGERPAGG